MAVTSTPVSYTHLDVYKRQTVDRVDAKMGELRVADAITEIFALFKRCNKYIDETMPWACLLYTSRCV